jgi:hypothetical protein
MNRFLLTILCSLCFCVAGYSQITAYGQVTDSTDYLSKMKIYNAINNTYQSGLSQKSHFFPNPFVKENNINLIIKISPRSLSGEGLAKKLYFPGPVFGPRRPLPYNLIPRH